MQTLTNLISAPLNLEKIRNFYIDMHLVLSWICYQTKIVLVWLIIGIYYSNPFLLQYPSTFLPFLQNKLTALLNILSNNPLSASLLLSLSTYLSFRYLYPLKILFLVGLILLKHCSLWLFFIPTNLFFKEKFRLGSLINKILLIWDKDQGGKILLSLQLNKNLLPKERIKKNNHHSLRLSANSRWDI